MSQQNVKAVVHKIVQGKHGPYAVTTAEGFDEGSITFSTKKDVWKDNQEPTPGDFVILNEIRKRRSGYRAESARFFKPEDKIHSKEQKMRKIKNVIRKWKSIYFTKDTEKIWKEYVESERLERRDLHNLLEDENMADAYKARALFLLLTPDFSWCPFKWKDVDRMGTNIRYGIPSDHMENIPPALVEYASELVIAFYSFLKKQNDDDRANEMHYLNAMVRKLLAMLPVDSDLSHDLFNLYEINDIRPFYNMDECSGYNPFTWFMGEEDLDERWKRKADDRFRQIILQELHGESKPREDFEEALARYCNHLLYLDGHYSNELFVDQIEFVINNAPKDRVCFSSFTVSRLLKAIEKEDKMDTLGAALSRFVMERSHLGGFAFDSVYSKESLETAQVMLELLKDDAPLSALLNKMIEDGKERIEARARKKEAEVSKKAEVLQKMSKK